MKLLVSAFLLLALSYPATAEVVPSFTGRCDDFFFMSQPPTGPTGGQYSNICQRTEDGYEYATLYDTTNKIPVYSAYDFHGLRTKTSSWDIEPQLDDQNGGPLMSSEGTVNRNLRGQKQALNEDYTGSNYDRGHLLPVNHRHSKSSADATFSLTNAAPQDPSFNRGQWRITELTVAQTLTTCFLNNLKAYVVTGVVPGNTKIKNRVNVPSHFWSAYCCADNNNRPQFSGAYYGKNDKSKDVKFMTIANLDRELTRVYRFPFHVFSNAC